MAQEKKTYNAFISYRRSSSIIADSIKTKIIHTKSSSYTEEDIFLDRHDIGPEMFDERLKIALEESMCTVLVVTKDCFKPKEDNEDWFLKEIEFSLQKGKTIIPLFFDGIKTLSTPDIIEQLQKSFSTEDIKKLTKSQGVIYSNEYPDASVEKLVDFIRQANEKKSFVKKMGEIMKGVGSLLGIIAVCFIFFFGLGCLWGYFSASSDQKAVLEDNTYVDETTLHFEHEGLHATYDVEHDTISINLSNYKSQARLEYSDLIFASLTYKASMQILSKNLAYLKYVKFLRGGGKFGKTAIAVASVVICVGAFCGFSQGSSVGRMKKQEEAAFKLYPALQQRSTWEPLLLKYPNLYEINRLHAMAIDPKGLLYVRPVDESCIAFIQGIKQPCIVLKYNNWTIGEQRFQDIDSEIEKARNKSKHVILLYPETLTIIEYRLPKGFVGLQFFPGNGEDGKYECALERYHTWKLEREMIK